MCIHVFTIHTHTGRGLMRPNSSYCLVVSHYMSEKFLYELLYLVPGSLSEQEFEPVLEEVRELIKGQKGEITNETAPVRRKLAYSINHLTHGFYILLYFKGPADAVPEINKILDHHPTVMRHVILRVDEMTELAPEKSLPSRKEQEEDIKKQRAAAVAENQKAREESKKTSEAKEETPAEEKPVKEAAKKEPKAEKSEDKKADKPETKEEPKKEKEEEKISLDDLDQKLDEILTSDNL